MKLNLGCGEKLMPGYINIDSREDLLELFPSIVIADVRRLPYEPGTVDDIRAFDVYEHVSHRESEALLKHWAELLKPGGKLTIQTTCLQGLDNAKNRMDVHIRIARMFGGQDYPENTHLTVGDPSLMVGWLRAGGVTGGFDIENGIGNGTNMRIHVRK